MRSTWKLEILIAALVVLLATPLLLAGDAGGADGTITVISGKDVKELRLGDFKDGETRTLDGPDGAVTITRDGDTLKVTVGGEELVVTPGESSRAFIMSSGEGAKAKVKRWVTVDSGSQGDHEVETVVVRKGDGTALTLDGAPFWVSSDDRVLYRCPKDGAELSVPKSDATMDSFTCPVCGTAMEKVEDGAHVRKRVIVKVESDKQSSED